MAIPFLQPEEDDSARHHGSGGPNGGAHAGAGAGSSAAGSAATGGPANAIVGGTSSSGSAAAIMVGATGPLPIPNSPAPVPIIVSSGTSTAVQTPLIGPMNGDQLVQLFYEALYRYSRGDTPSTPISQSPQSSSCSPFTTGYYNSGGGGGGGGSAGYGTPGTTTGQVFFPQTPNGVYRPSVGGFGTSGVFFGQPPTPSPSGSSSHSSQHSANSPETPSCSSAPPVFHQFPTSYQLPSTANASTATNWAHGGHDGDDSSESDSSSQPSSISEGTATTGCSPRCLGLPGTHHHHTHHLLDVGSSSSSSGTGISTSISSSTSSSSSGSTMPSMSGYIPPHMDYVARREQLQEFAGKIPQRKKKSSSSSSSSSKSSSKSKKSKFLEQTLVWPTLAVTATLIALGCGLLAAR